MERAGLEVSWVCKVADEAAAIIGELGLTGALGEFIAPTGNTLTTEEATASLNAFVRRAHVHNWTALPERFAERQQAAAKAPAVLPSVDLHPPGVAVVAVPGLDAVDGRGEAATVYAEALNEALRTFDSRVSRWLFDLRDNDGGNMHPMLAGLAAVLGTGTQCGFRDRHGNDTYVDLTSDDVRIEDNVLAEVPDASPLAQRPSGVLIGPRTASSGEFVALCLHARAGAVLLGQPTAGYLSGVEIHELPSGAALGVTSVNALDHQGNLWPEQLQPQVTVAEGNLDAAIQTLDSRPANSQ